METLSIKINCSHKTTYHLSYLFKNEGIIYTENVLFSNLAHRAPRFWEIPTRGGEGAGEGDWL